MSNLLSLSVPHCRRRNRWRIRHCLILTGRNQCRALRRVTASPTHHWLLAGDFEVRQRFVCCSPRPDPRGCRRSHGRSPGNPLQRLPTLCRPRDAPRCEEHTPQRESVERIGHDTPALIEMLPPHGYIKRKKLTSHGIPEPRRHCSWSWRFTRITGVNSPSHQQMPHVGTAEHDRGRLVGNRHLRQWRSLSSGRLCGS
jgi:hypothetical protein